MEGWGKELGQVIWLSMLPPLFSTSKPTAAPFKLLVPELMLDLRKALLTNETVLEGFPVRGPSPCLRENLSRKVIPSLAPPNSVSH